MLSWVSSGARGGAPGVVPARECISSRPEACLNIETPMPNQASLVVIGVSMFYFASRNAFAITFRSLTLLLYLLKVHICNLFVVTVASLIRR